MKIKRLISALTAVLFFSATGIISYAEEAAHALTAENPSTGVNIGITAAVICGVIVVGCIVFGIITKKKRK